MRFVDDAAAVKELDRDLEREGPLFLLDHWGETLLKTGVSIEHMGQQKALLMAAGLVKRFGKRRHVALLHRHKSAESLFGREVIQNADFEVRLRSLD